MRMLTDMQMDEIKRRYGDQRLWEHACNTAQMAQELARRWRQDAEAAFTAGLLHDIAKRMDAAQALVEAERLCIIPDPVQHMNPMLLHGPIAAKWAKRDYGLHAVDILQAIAYHTTGRGGMSMLEKLVYLADKAEPARGYPGVARVRQLCQEDIEEAMNVSLEGGLIELLERRKWIHPDSIAAWNDQVATYRKQAL